MTLVCFVCGSGRDEVVVSGAGDWSPGLCESCRGKYVNVQLPPPCPECEGVRMERDGDDWVSCPACGGTGCATPVWRDE